MAENDFNLGQAMGDYEKAKADREFYLSMIQQGQSNRGAYMASPIAAYLAGVAGVKMASMKQQAVEAQQAITDAEQQKKDAQRAAERAIQRGDNLRNNLFQIAKSARNGDIAKGSAGVLAGQIVREMGATPVSFDADNGILTYDYDGEEYELDLNEKANAAQKGKELQNLIKEQNLEAGRVRAAQAKTKGELDIALKRKKLAGGEGKGGPSLSNRWQTFKTGYGPIIDSINQKDIVTDLSDYPDDLIVGFIGDYDPDFGIDNIYEIVKREAQDRGLSLPNKKATSSQTRNRYEGMSDDDFLKSMPR